MSTPNKTPWFHRDVKPALPGVYERRYDGNSYFARWNGKCWLRQNVALYVAQVAREASVFQSLKWRGLAVKP